jgi:hypothetical protein
VASAPGRSMAEMREGSNDVNMDGPLQSPESRSHDSSGPWCLPGTIWTTTGQHEGKGRQVKKNKRSKRKGSVIDISLRATRLLLYRPISTNKVRGVGEVWLVHIDQGDAFFIARHKARMRSWGVVSCACCTVLCNIPCCTV